MNFTAIILPNFPKFSLMLTFRKPYAYQTHYIRVYGFLELGGFNELTNS